MFRGRRDIPGTGWSLLSENKAATAAPIRREIGRRRSISIDTQQKIIRKRDTYRTPEYSSRLARVYEYTSWSRSQRNGINNDRSCESSRRNRRAATAIEIGACLAATADRPPLHSVPIPIGWKPASPSRVRPWNEGESAPYMSRSRNQSSLSYGISASMSAGPWTYVYLTLLRYKKRWK